MLKKKLYYKFCCLFITIAVVVLVGCQVQLKDSEDEDNGVETSYTVEHWKQSVDGKNYELDEQATQKINGNSLNKTQAAAREYTGFTALPITQKQIEADGSTVVKLQYNRNTITYTFAANGGVWEDSSVNKSVSGLYGAELPEVKNPEKTGYLFEGWNSDIPERFGEQNLTFTAKWKEVEVSEPEPQTDPEPQSQQQTNPDPDPQTNPEPESNPEPETNPEPEIIPTPPPAVETTYKVEHLQQNINDDEYVVVSGDTQTLDGTAGSQTQAAAKNYEGFEAAAITQKTIAEDGSTVIQIFYNRKVINYYFSALEQTKSGRYGAAVIVPDNPARAGYKFAGWDKNIPSTFGTADITFNPVWVELATLTVKLNYPDDKDVSKVTAALYENNPTADEGEELSLENASATFVKTAVPDSKNMLLKFYLYNSYDICVGTYEETICLPAGQDASLERTVDNVDTYAVVVIVNNREPWIDSSLSVTAKASGEEYSFTPIQGTNKYITELSEGEYDIYLENVYTNKRINIASNGTGGITLNYLFASASNFADLFANSTGSSNIILLGELTENDLLSISAAIKNSSRGVRLDLRRTSGLTELPDELFKGCYDLQEIKLPDGITSIGENAFSNCSNLTSIVIPDSVTSIGEYAFYGCLKLKNITLSSALTKIQAYTFYGCAIGKINIPAAVTEIGNYAFARCLMTNLTIPGNVETIGRYAFQNNSVKNVTLRNGVKTIQSRAFDHCDSLETVTIPSSVTKIEAHAFSNCRKVQTVSFPNTSNWYIDSLPFSLVADGSIAKMLTDTHEGDTWTQGPN